LLIWSIPDLIAHLSRLCHLQSGDLIYTGTPEGVGAVQPGDRIEGSIAAAIPSPLDDSPNHECSHEGCGEFSSKDDAASQQKCSASQRVGLFRH